ncbi:hypothetical protein K502DRAFT_362529 [Neoconidiobolus thromboides FSU 785]|nr:hypothetical protein K502DRAFT_362529 [Neoconidiobolus thromboides FSU 785]
MFQPEYIIQTSAVFVVFLLWLFTSFALRFFQFNSTKHEEAAAESNTANPVIIERNNYRASVAAERTLLDGFLLLSIGVIFNIFAQGNRTSGDVFSLIIMFALFFMTIFHFTGHNSFTFGLWILISLALLGLFITPFATRSYWLGFYNVATPVVTTTPVVV